MSNSVISITDPAFEAEVLQANQLVLLYFWADWCGPCRLMSPVMDWVAQTYGDRIKVVKMEIDPNPETVAKYQVEGVPALRLVNGQEVLESTEGALSRARVEELLSPYLAATA